MQNDPYCMHCTDAVICDVKHYFCSCVRVSHIWSDIQATTVSLVGQNLSNLNLINFNWCASDDEAVWLIGNQLDVIWNLLNRKRINYLKKGTVFGFLIIYCSCNFEIL